MIDGTEKPKIPSKFWKHAARYNEFGSNGIRTRGLCVRAAALYRLSYEDPFTGGRPIYWVHQPVKGMKHRMKLCELREYTNEMNMRPSQWIAIHSVFHSFHGLMNSTNWRSSNVWVFIAQLGEHCSAYAEATGSNPVEALKTFFRAVSQLLKLLFTAMGHFICIPAVHIISLCVWTI